MFTLLNIDLWLQRYWSSCMRAFMTDGAVYQFRGFMCFMLVKHRQFGGFAGLCHQCIALRVVTFEGLERLVLIGSHSFCGLAGRMPPQENQSTAHDWGPLFEVHGHTRGITALALHGSRLISGSYDGSLRFTSLKTGVVCWGDVFL